MTKKKQYNNIREEEENSIERHKNVSKNYRILSATFTNELDSIEKKSQLESGVVENKRISTGILCYDLFVNGGITIGMYSISGPEQSGKSTVSWNVVRSAINQKIPIIKFYNPEQTLDVDYGARILQVDDKSEVFGKKDEKGDKWVKPPVARYYTSPILENVLDDMKNTLNRLPDKEYLKTRDEWFLVFENTKKDKIRMQEFQKNGLNNYDKKLFGRTGKFWCSIGDDDNFQAVFILDSWPALVLKKQYDEDAGDNSMGQQARAFSDYIKKVKGNLISKRAIIWGVNQLRERPAVMMGCLAWNSKILLSDGSYKNIKTIVDNKENVEVLTKNPYNNKIEPKKVIDWYDNGLASKSRWLEFKLDIPFVYKSVKLDLKVTENHNIMLSNGLIKPARNIKKGDKLSFVPQIKSFDEKQKQVLLGSILGNSINIDRYHGILSLDSYYLYNDTKYYDWKSSILKDIIFNHCSNMKSIEKIRKRLEPWWLNVLDETTYSHPSDEIIMYNTSPTLIREIDPLGLAVWAMDDNSKNKNNIKLQSFSIEDAENIINNLNYRFGIDLKFNEWKDSLFNRDFSYGAYIKDSGLMELIAPHVPSFKHDKFFKKHKIREWKHNGIIFKPRYNRDKNYYCTSATVKDIQEIKVDGNRYDLQIEDNHNYIADGVVVLNSPEYEPGGNTLKYFSDVRTQLRPRSRMQGWDNKEPSVQKTGKKDSYDYKLLKAVKNKLGSPLDENEVWLRTWKSDYKKEGHGVDPVFDTYQYLLLTNQISGRKANFSINLKSVENIKFDWNKFKKLILAHYFNDKNLRKEIKSELKIKKLPDIREECFDQINNKTFKDLINFGKKQESDKDIDNFEETDIDDE